MKKYAWATQMNAAEAIQASNVVIKRQRNARMILNDPQPIDNIQLAWVLSSIETLKI